MPDESGQPRPETTVVSLIDISTGGGSRSTRRRRRSGRDHDDAGGNLQHSLTVNGNVRICRPEALKCGERGLKFGCGRLPFESQEGPAGANQGQAPPAEPVQRSKRSGRYDVVAVIDVELLRTNADDLNPFETEAGDRLLEEPHPTKHRLDERDPKVGSAQRQDQTWKSGSATDVGDGCIRLDRRRHHGAVEEMPLPESGNLPGTNQSPLDTGRRE